jgi:hypothetical protein
MKDFEIDRRSMLGFGAAAAALAVYGMPVAASAQGSGGDYVFLSIVTQVPFWADHRSSNQRRGGGFVAASGRCRLLPNVDGRQGPHQVFRNQGLGALRLLLHAVAVTGRPNAVESPSTALTSEVFSSDPGMAMTKERSILGRSK